MWIKTNAQYVNTNAAEAVYVKKSTLTANEWLLLLWCPPSNYTLGKYPTKSSAVAAMEKLVRKLGTIK